MKAINNATVKIVSMLVKLIRSKYFWRFFILIIVVGIFAVLLFSGVWK